VVVVAELLGSSTSAAGGGGPLIHPASQTGLQRLRSYSVPARLVDYIAMLYDASYTWNDEILDFTKGENGGVIR